MLKTVQQEEIGLWLGQLTVADEENRGATILPQLVTRLLEQYEHIFRETKDLPPERATDHTIVLKEGQSQ